MVMIMEGGYDEKYAVELEYDYNGLYSRFVDKIYFRGKYNKDIIDQYGISIKGDYVSGYGGYTIYKEFTWREVDEVKHMDMDNKVYDVLKDHIKDSTIEITITEEDLEMCKREAKLIALQKKIKKEKTLRYKIRKLFKL